ncbi:unnamed protein product [Amoebophrya sp. A25]|nr:unnamed protein product [Amoebophrya sp. A25]|eukprot:GSA25T00020860001.1
MHGRGLARIMNLQSYFLNKHCQRADKYLAAWETSQKVGILANLINYVLSAIVATFLVVIAFERRDDIPRPLIGLSVTYCFVLPFFCNLIALFWFSVSLGLMQVERVFDLQETRQEEQIEAFRKAWEVYMLAGLGKSTVKTKSLSLEEKQAKGRVESIPRLMEEGKSVENQSIRFKDCALRYAPVFPLAISGFNLTVKRGEHIGICGQTGAGKSSICQPRAGKYLHRRCRHL